MLNDPHPQKVVQNRNLFLNHEIYCAVENLEKNEEYISVDDRVRYYKNENSKTIYEKENNNTINEKENKISKDVPIIVNNKKPIIKDCANSVISRIEGKSNYFNKVRKTHSNATMPIL